MLHFYRGNEKHSRVTKQQQSLLQKYHIDVCE